MSSLRDAALLLFEALDQIGIHYAIGGSFASSFHGIARATQDLNLVVELPTNRVRDLFQAVSNFYADEETMLEAIRRGLSFNLIHLDSGFKFDLFVAGRHPLGRDQLRHRRRVRTALLGWRPDRCQHGLGRRYCAREAALVSGRRRDVGETVE